MAYDIIGNVVDSADNELKDVLVSDGTQNIKTNNDGYYELKTEKNKLTFSKNGFVTQTFDLSKYKNPSSVNVDITLQTTSNNNIPTPKNNKNRLFLTIGLSVVALVGGYLLYKKYIK